MHKFAEYVLIKLKIKINVVISEILSIKKNYIW